MKVIFIRDDELHIQTGRKKKFNPSNSWANLLKMMKKKRTGHNGSGDRRQRVYLNIKYRPVNTKQGQNLAKAHLDYIVRHGVGKDGKDPELFGNITSQQLLDIKPGEERQFRMILSPEYPGDVDLNKFIESYMRYISAISGYDLQWVASNHYNTAHPHCHIIIKGVDKNLRPVRFTKHQIKHQFRGIAEDFLTFLLGERVMRNEINLQRAKSTRYTFLDKKIETAASNHFITRKQIDMAFRPAEIEMIRSRLSFLTEIGLIESTQAGFHLTPGWPNILKQIGKCDEFMAALKSIKYNHPTQTVNFNRKEHKSICGIISCMGKKDEMSDYNFMIVEALDGKNYICDLSPFTKLKVNDVVAFDTQQFRVIRTVGQMEFLLKSKPESALKQQITRTILDLQKGY